MIDSWIKLHRKFTEWEWYADANTMRVFMHLLLTANYKQNRWQGQVIDQGQVVTSVGSLAASLKLSTKQIRTALDKLKSTNEIDVKGQARYSLVTLINWALYQQVEVQEGKQRANKGQTEGELGATLKEVKKVISKEVKTKEHVPSDSFLEFWSQYPTKPNNPRKPSSIKFDSLVAKGIDPAVIIQGAIGYRAYCKSEGTQSKYIAQATTWLNQERWTNDYTIDNKSTGSVADSWTYEPENNNNEIKEVN